MNLSINTSATATISTTNSHLSAAVLKQAQTSPATAQTTASLTVQDPQKLQQALQGHMTVLFGIPGQLTADTKSIANALVPSMQSLILQRPDLANAQFDFSADNGAIKVTSDSLSDSDRAWLQTTFNQSGALVKAVNQFHDDAVAGYVHVAKLDGDSLSTDDLAAVNKQADGIANFMSLFKRIGAAEQPSLNDSGGTYVAQNGAKVDLSQPSTAVGFLSFMQSANAMAAGTATLHLPQGQTYQDALKGDVFGNIDAMPRFLPPSYNNNSLGMHEIA